MSWTFTIETLPIYLDSDDVKFFNLSGNFGGW